MGKLFLPEDIWTKQPQYPAQIDKSGRLFDATKISCVIASGVSNKIDALSGKIYDVSTNPAVAPTVQGKGTQWVEGASSYIELNTDADNILDTVSCTMLIATVRTSANTFTGVSYGYDGGATDRSMVHLPYTDGNLYWDFGNATGGSGRLSVPIPSYLAAGTINIWGFSAGSRGREIWRNGVMLTSDSTATASRSATTRGFRIGAADAGLSEAPAHNDSLFVLSKEQWSRAALAKLTANPWQIFASQQRGIDVDVIAGGTITADANITQASNTSDSTATITLAADASITASSDTASSTALLSIAADASITQSSDTASGAAALSIVADASITAAGDTTSSASVLSVTVDASISQAGDTSTADGAVVISADCSAAQADNTLTSAAALVADTITANASITQADNTPTADGVLLIAADTSVTQVSDTTASTSALLLSGDANITQTGDTLASVAALASDTITANGDITQASNTATADGLLSIVAGASITQDSNTITFDSVLLLAAYADLTQAGNTLTSASGSNTWLGEAFSFASPITREFNFASPITRTLNFASPIQ